MHETWLDEQWRTLRQRYSTAGPSPFPCERVRQDMINLALSGSEENVDFARSMLGAEWVKVVTDSLLECVKVGDFITAEILLKLCGGLAPDGLWGAIASGQGCDSDKAAFVRELKAGALSAAVAPGVLARAAGTARARGDEKRPQLLGGTSE